ncbi:MAG: zinc ribbon domain-containing protein [Patescibacteria group bacterium]
MALIKCPECGNDVSDKATACPRCGNPRSVMPSNPHARTKFFKLRNNQNAVFFGISVAFISMAFFNASALFIKAFPWAKPFHTGIYIVPILTGVVCLGKLHRKMPTGKDKLIYMASWLFMLCLFTWMGFMMV